MVKEKIQKREVQNEQKPKKEKKKKSDSEKKSRRAKQIKVLKIGLLSIALFLTVVYFLLKVLYNPGDFTVFLGNDFSRDNGIVMYESIKDKKQKKILAASTLPSMDNISIDWIPKDINDEKDGSHNGDNYMAYTFYIEHEGIEPLNYWYSIYIDNVFKNVDEAIRVAVYLNGQETVYAKLNKNGNPERGTKPFYSADRILLEEREDIKPGDIDKFTIVIWIEGDDPDCLDPLIGGTMKMHMEITDEKNITT